MWYYKVKCGSYYEFSATHEEITTIIVAAFKSGDNATVQEALLSPVEDIFASESFQTDVFSGGNTTKFDENIATVTTAINNTAANIIQNLPTGTAVGKVADIQSKFDGILGLISLLGNAARGDEDFVYQDLS